MAVEKSDAMVLFGVAGDLAHKKIFPALQAMVRSGQLDVPVIGVARREWSLEQWTARVRDSLEQQIGVDVQAFAKLSRLLRYVRGDYHDAATFERLRKTLGSAAQPLYYLAIPPSLFTTVIEGLATSGCVNGARVVVEKPFGQNFASAQALNRTLHQLFPRSRHFSL